MRNGWGCRVTLLATHLEDLHVGTPQICSMIWKGPSQMLDSSWSERNVIFVVSWEG